MTTPINTPTNKRKYTPKQPSAAFKPPYKQGKKPWHTDLKDADLERMLEKLECIATDVESAVDVILERLGVEDIGGSTDEEEEGDLSLE